MQRLRTVLPTGLLALAACGGGEPGSAPAVGPPLTGDLYWEPVDDFFAGELRWETARQDEEAPVRLGATSTMPFLTEGGYDLPFLEMPPTAEVLVLVPPDVGDLRFEAFVGAKQSVGGESAVSARFEVLVDGEVAAEAERAWLPGMELADRQWRALEPVTVPAGGHLLLRTTLLDADDPDAPPPAIGFGRPRFLRAVERPAPPDAPNVVFVLMDTLRRDRVSAYDDSRALTPNVGAWAEGATVYEHAYATSSWTWPSTASLMTGLLPEEHGVLSPHESYLHNSAETLPELMREAGLYTAGFSRNPLIDVCHNFDQGFDEFRDATWEFDKSGTVAPDVRQWLRDRDGERPFFLYLHLVDPHVPYDPLPQFAGDAPRPKVLDDRPNLPMELRERLIAALEESATTGAEYRPFEHVRMDILKALRDEYDRCVQSADHWVGAILDELDALGLTDDTLVVFTSDHGEEFLEHGLLAHASSLHRELTSVPLIVAGPGFEPGRRVARPVANRQLAATLLRAVGGDPSALHQRDHVDLADVDALPDAPIFLSTRTTVFRGVRATPCHGMLDGETLVHVYDTDPEAEGPLQGAPDGRFVTRVFDLATDPHARVDVADRDPERTRALRDVVLERTDRAHALRAETAPELAVGAGEAGLELLEAIGYIEGGGDEGERDEDATPDAASPEEPAPEGDDDDAPADEAH